MNVGDDPLDYMRDDHPSDAPPRPPPSSEHYKGLNNSPYLNAHLTMNGPTGLYNRNHTGSPNSSLQSGGSGPHTQTTVTTTVTKVTRQYQPYPTGGSQSPLPQENSYNPYSRGYSPYQGSQNQLPPPSPGRGGHHSPASSQGRGTPTRFIPGDYDPDYNSYHPPDAYGRPSGGYGGNNHVPNDNVADSFDQQFPYRDGAYPDQVGPGGRDHPFYRDQPSEDHPPPYSSVHPGERYNGLPPADMDRGNPYRATPPMDDTYHNPANESYQSLPRDDRDTNSPSNPYGRYPRGPPSDIDRYQEHDRLRGYPQEGGRNPREDDPYSDARPLDEDPYGRPYPEDPSRRTPSPFSDGKWRNPDLHEVIDFLNSMSNAVKANAAAYLQHLCYMDDDVKTKTRVLGGIQRLVELVNNDIPEVHRAACGALRNLSYGRANDDNKRAIKNASGIPALVRLLRKSPDNDVRELVTGILWNLSSCQDLKKPIIDDGLTVLVNNVLIPHSGWERNLDEDSLKRPRDIYWSTVFRNASGVLRNISSDGEYARRKLRECEGLVDAILFIVKAAIGKNDIDNKSVENCVCVLRNLSYACQEVEDPTYIKRRTMPKQQPAKGDNTGCFGGGKKKKEPNKIDQRGRAESGYQRPRTEPIRGMELLWQPDIVHVYLPLLSDCSNPDTLEAAAGAIQNLAACDWQPSVDIRAAVRKERGLPIVVELLTIEADRVVCAAATALRNLALDIRNKELIGKYAMRQLVQKLPRENQPAEFPVSDDTITAVQATLYEVIRKNPDFAQSLLNEGGVERLVYITHSHGKFSSKVVKFAASILYTMWQFKELHPEYRNKGLKEHHFVTKTMAARGGPSPSANNTLNRPRMDLGGHTGYSEPTPPTGARHVGNSVPPSTGNQMAYRDPGRGPDGRDPYGRDDRLRPEDIPMSHMGSSSNLPPNPNYAAIDHPQQPLPRDREDYRPPGGVPLFPNLPPSTQQPQPQVDSREPLYAQVNKTKRRQDHMMLDGGGPEGGADSWV